MLSEDAPQVILTGLLTVTVRDPSRTGKHRLQIEVAVEFVDEDLAQCLLGVKIDT